MATHDYYGEGCDADHSAAVCSKPRGNTQQGLCDMVGNLWEMVGSGSVARGGSFLHNDASIAHKLESDSSVGLATIQQIRENGGVGFRCAKVASDDVVVNVPNAAGAPSLRPPDTIAKLDGSEAAPAPPSPVLGEPGPYRINAAAGTVLDTRTGLAWQLVADRNEFDWQQATSHCKSLILNGNGWRLPSQDELELLVEKSKSHPINSTAFPRTQATTFWSSTQNEGSSKWAWVVHFRDSQSPADLSRLERQFSARCVRATESPSSQTDQAKSKTDSAQPAAERPDLIDGRYLVQDGGKTVKDFKSGLVWQRTARIGLIDDAVSSVEALEYCKELKLAGGGWRLPDPKELEAILVPGQVPAINRAAFPATPPLFFFSSRWGSQDNGIRWAVWFGSGAVQDGEKSVGSRWIWPNEAVRVRCVR